MPANHVSTLAAATIRANEWRSAAVFLICSVPASMIVFYAYGLTLGPWAFAACVLVLANLFSAIVAQIMFDTADRRAIARAVHIQTACQDVLDDMARRNVGPIKARLRLSYNGLVYLTVMPRTDGPTACEIKRDMVIAANMYSDAIRTTVAITDSEFDACLRDLVKH
jgi:hypothetical protein